jgi:hypothetical protein
MAATICEACDNKFLLLLTEINGIRTVWQFTHLTLEAHLRLPRPPNWYGCRPDRDSHLFSDFGGEADLRSYLSDGLCLTKKPHHVDLLDLLKLLP